MCLYLYDTVILAHGHQQDKHMNPVENFELYFLRIHLHHVFPDCPFPSRFRTCKLFTAPSLLLIFIDFTNRIILREACPMNYAANRYTIFYFLPLLPLPDVQISCTLLFIESKRQISKDK
jgi:hypothetical protein